MSRCAIILCGLMLFGCATTQPLTTSTSPVEVIAIDDFDDAVTASALLFDPPMYADGLRPDLSRAGREASAFVGYEDQTTTFSYVYTDDQQLSRGSGSHRDRYERRAIVERFGSSTR